MGPGYLKFSDERLPGHIQTQLGDSLLKSLCQCLEETNTPLVPVRFGRLILLVTLMLRIFNFVVVLYIICGHALFAANPDDIEFRARLVKEAGVFHMGESIEMEISYSSQAEKKYFGSFSGPSPELAGVTPSVSPLDGVLDLRELRRDRGWAGSILGGYGYVGPKPTTQQLDLARWYRFQRPGHYSVIFTSIEVSRMKSPEEGGGKEPLTLESSPVDFDILPADPAWVGEQLGNIEQALKTAGNDGAHSVALYHLALLDTPASVRMLVELYLASSDGGVDWAFNSGLRDSSQIDVIIPLLEAVLSDPTAHIPSDLPGLLADLQTRKELGVMPAYPSDPGEQQKWTELLNARAKVHNKYLAQAHALLVVSIEKRSGPQRATAIYQAWLDANALNATKPVAPEERSRLESNVLAVADDLDHAQQVQFVILAWQTMPHAELLPLIRELAKDSFNHPAGYDSHEAFQLWCEERPEECGAAILQNVLETNAKMDKNVILLMPEAEHPELDKIVETQLRDPALLWDAFQSQRTAAVILRAGSRNVIPAVDLYLDQSTGTRRCDGVTRGELLGYLFRVAPEDGGKRLAAELEARNDFCSSEVLRTLHQVRPSDELIPIVTKALNSPNLGVAQLAAIYLGEHGSASTEDALWQRLQALWTAWQGRSSELPNEIMNFGTDDRNQNATLERALASALSHARNWKLGPTELDRLHSGCLTQPCRDIADGKMSLGL